MANSKSLVTGILMIFLAFVSRGQDWPKIYGGDISTYGEAILEHYDKGICFLGSVITSGNNFEYGWLFKTDINGNVIWDKKYEDGNAATYFADFEESNDHGLIICGYTSLFDDQQGDPLFIKLNACAEIEWCKIFHSYGYNLANDIVCLPNGEFIGLLSNYENNSEHSNSLVKMDATGEPVWIKPVIHKDSLDFQESASELYVTPDSNYLICGYQIKAGMFPFWIKLDAEAETLWELSTNNGEGNAWNMLFSRSGAYYGSASYAMPEEQILPTVFKFSESGVPINEFQLTGDTIYTGGAGSMVFNPDSTISIFGAWHDTLSNGFGEIWKLDTNGNILDSRQLIDQSPPIAFMDIGYENKILASTMLSINGNWDVYFWKMNSDLEDDTLYTQPLIYDSLCAYEINSDTINIDCDGLYINIDEIPTKEEYESTIIISPNPAREWITLTLPDVKLPEELEISIYNLFGQVVIKKEVSHQNNTASLNISGLSQGFYLATCKDSKNKILKGKFEIIR